MARNSSAFLFSWPLSLQHSYQQLWIAKEIDDADYKQQNIINEDVYEIG